MGKDTLTFVNADKNKIGNLISKYSHFRTNFEGITIHNNGNINSTARGDVNWALNNLPGVSWHYSVDDKEVVRFLAHPDFWNYSSWSCGDGARGFGNAKTINIEINEFKGYTNPKDPKWIKARENAIHLVAQLLFDYGWGIDKIYTHKDHNGKNCPRVILKELNQFKNEVQIILNKMKNLA